MCSGHTENTEPAPHRTTAVLLLLLLGENDFSLWHRHENWFGIQHKKVLLVAAFVVWRRSRRAVEAVWGGEGLANALGYWVGRVEMAWVICDLFRVEAGLCLLFFTAPVDKNGCSLVDRV